MDTQTPHTHTHTIPTYAALPAVLPVVVREGVLVLRAESPHQLQHGPAPLPGSVWRAAEGPGRPAHGVPPKPTQIPRAQVEKQLQRRLTGRGAQVSNQSDKVLVGLAYLVRYWHLSE